MLGRLLTEYVKEGGEAVPLVVLQREAGLVEAQLLHIDAQEALKRATTIGYFLKKDPKDKAIIDKSTSYIER